MATYSWPYQEFGEKWRADISSYTAPEPVYVRVERLQADLADLQRRLKLVEEERDQYKQDAQEWADVAARYCERPPENDVIAKLRTEVQKLKTERNDWRDRYYQMFYEGHEQEIPWYDHA